jgi:hypothetical protein
MPNNHREVRFIGREHRFEVASLIGESCRRVTEKLFATAHEELALRRCRHITYLGKQYGNRSLEKICEMALRLELFLPEDIEAMLKLGLDVEKDATPKATLSSHEYLRGKAAFLLNDENKGDEND